MKDTFDLQYNNVMYDMYKEHGYVKLGMHTSYTWRKDPKHILFSLSRYKFCSKLLHGLDCVLEVGCGDGLGSSIILQEVKKMYCIDIEKIIIEDNIKRNEFPDRLIFKCSDVLKERIDEIYNAVLSLDVIEHIDQKNENLFFENILSGLVDNGFALIGTPNINSQKYASTISKEGHINLKDHDSLRSTLKKFFRNVFIFSMNDEIVHTGYYPMAHYLIALATNKI